MRVRLLMLGLVLAVGMGTGQLNAQGTRWCEQLPRAAYQGLERVAVTDDWYQVYRVASGVFAIYEPYQFQEVISYLIVGTGGALLFDTGMGMSRISAIVKGLTSLPVQVLNSHTHFDHIGGNAEFAHILAMDTDFTRDHARFYPPGAYHDDAQPSALCRPLPNGVTADSWQIRPFTPERFIRDGYRIDLGDRELQVIHVPGHTPDAIALLDAKAGLLWTGDSYYEGPIWLYFPETDLNAYQASIDRLAALAPTLRLLLPAHNIPVASPRRLLQLKDAIVAMRSGAVTAKPSADGALEFPFEGFSILTSRAALAQKPIP